MQNLPHSYVVSANARVTGNVDLRSPGLAAIESAAPAAFGGPGDRWSPETLLAAALAGEGGAFVSDNEFVDFGDAPGCRGECRRLSCE